MSAPADPISTGGLLWIYFKALFYDIGQWLDLVALVVSVAGATSDDPIVFLWSLVVIYGATIVAETKYQKEPEDETKHPNHPNNSKASEEERKSLEKKHAARNASRDTRKMYRAVNYLAIFIAVAGLIFCQIAKDAIDQEASEIEVNGTSTNESLCNMTSSFKQLNGVSDDDDGLSTALCEQDSDSVKKEYYIGAGKYICAVLAVSEGASDTIGLILGIPEIILVALEKLLSNKLGARAKAALHGINVLIGSYVLTLESEGYIHESSEEARYVVQRILIPLVFCVYFVIAMLVTWPRTDVYGNKEKKWCCCEAFELVFFNRYSTKDNCCTCGSKSAQLPVHIVTK